MLDFLMRRGPDDDVARRGFDRAIAMMLDGITSPVTAPRRRRRGWAMPVS
jgi:hypothetical protein